MTTLDLASDLHLSRGERSADMLPMTEHVELLGVLEPPRSEAVSEG